MGDLHFNLYTNVYFTNINLKCNSICLHTKSNQFLTPSYIIQYVHFYTVYSSNNYFKMCDTYAKEKGTAKQSKTKVLSGVYQMDQGTELLIW